MAKSNVIQLSAYRAKRRRDPALLAFEAWANFWWSLVLQGVVK